MGKKKDKPIDVNNMTPDEKLKFEVAEEIGCAQKVLEGGWRSLSAKESGRIGGILNKRKRQMRAELEASEGSGWSTTGTLSWAMCGGVGKRREGNQ